LPLTTFIGRKREMAEVRRRLSAERLVTLVGMGGVGKTRLALELARDLCDEYPGAVFLTELAPLTDGTMVPASVAQAIGTAERPDRPLRDSLADRIGLEQALLILDNCEHVIDAAGALAEFLLQR